MKYLINYTSSRVNALGRVDERRGALKLMLQDTSLSLKCKILSHTHGKKSRYRSARLPSCLWSARAQLSCVRAQPSPRAGSVCSRYTLYVVRRLCSDASACPCACQPRRRGAARRPCSAPTQVAGRCTGMRSEQAAHGIIVGGYRRRMGVAGEAEGARDCALGPGL